VDIATRFAWILPLLDKFGTTIAAELLKLFLVFGFPKIIGSDNGSEFVNEIMAQIVEKSGMDHRLISAYHPRANGVAERLVGTTSTAIFKLLEGRDDEWEKYCGAVQFAYNMKISDITGSRPYTLMFGRGPNGLIDYTNETGVIVDPETIQKRLNYLTDLVYPTIFEKVKRKHDKRNFKFLKNNRIIYDNFADGALVMVKDELRKGKSAPRYEGPFTVVRRTAGGAYEIRGPDGTLYKRPPSVLKLVDPGIVDRRPGLVAEVSKILDEKIVNEEPWYLVHWKGTSSNLDSWVAEVDFIDHEPIRTFRTQRLQNSEGV
jgi:hypothetical protein